MSAEHITPVEGTVVQAADRFAKQPPAEPPQDAIRLGREHGGEVEKVAEREPRRTAGEVTLEAAVLTGTGLAHIVQTVWDYQTAGEIAEQIRAAKAAKRHTKDRDERARLGEEIESLRGRRRQIAHDRHREPVTIAGAIAGVVYPAGLIVGTLAVGPLVLAGVLPIPLALYVAGRKARKQRELPHVVAGEVELTHAEGAPSAELVQTIPGVYSPANLPAGKPFVIDLANNEPQAAECILRALLKEAVPVGDVSEVEHTPWGWQCIVRITSGTHAKTITAAPDLETTFDTGHGSVRVQPLIERRARAKFRVVLSDPFATAPPPPYRAPKSLSITDRALIGSSIDGDPLAITLSGVMGEAIAASGGGKTGILQALGEVTTACYDTITIDLDPAGDGLEDLGPAARLQGRTHEQIEHVLLFLLMLAKARARLRKTLGMGRKWHTSPEHPSIVVFIDEYPALSRLGKKLAFDLLKVGRKEAIPVVIASQGGTTAYLGENIAQMLAMKIVGPCKKVDTNAVFGDGSAAEGWLPHRLSPATDTDPRDAGHVYAQGVPGTADAPIEYKIHEHPKGQLARLAAERRDAGLLDPDVDSLAAMQQVDLPDYVEPEYDADGDIKKPAPVELLTWEQLLRLCDADPPAVAVTPDTPARETARKALAVMEERDVDRMRTEPLADALGMGPAQLRELLSGAGVERCQLGPWDGMSNPSGYKLAHLRAAL